MDCDGYHELILADLDDTLSASERDAVRAHLAGCALCRSARALEAELGARLRRVRHRIETPPAVQERLRVALVRETVGAPGARHDAWARFSRRGSSRWRSRSGSVRARTTWQPGWPMTTDSPPSRASAST